MTFHCEDIHNLDDGQNEDEQHQGEQQKGLMNNCFPIIVKFREKLFFFAPVM